MKSIGLNMKGTTYTESMIIPQSVKMEKLCSPVPSHSFLSMLYTYFSGMKPVSYRKKQMPANEVIVSKDNNAVMNLK